MCCKYAKFIEMFPNIYTKKPITNQHVIACRTPQDVEPIKLCHWKRTNPYHMFFDLLYNLILNKIHVYT